MSEVVTNCVRETLDEPGTKDSIIFSREEVVPVQFIVYLLPAGSEEHEVLLFGSI